MSDSVGAPDEELVLRRVIDQAQAYGFFGPGDISAALIHAEGFVRVALGVGSARGSWLDLGSGGGLPGLVGLVRCAGSQWSLLDAMEKRVKFLEWAADQFSDELRTSGRLSVVHGRAEIIARLPGSVESFDVVVARGFAPPAVTAECASRFLRIGGVLVVSEPPGGQGERWSGLDTSGIGLVLEAIVLDPPSGAGFSVIRKVKATPEKFPRSGAALAKRPLFT